MQALRLDEYRALIEAMSADNRARNRSGPSAGGVRREPVMT